MTKSWGRCAIWIALICATLVATSMSPVCAQDGDKPPQRDPAAEGQILDRLAQVSPEAVPVFADATQALDAGDMEAATLGFRHVLLLAPRFPEASLRLSEAELALGDVGSARRHAFQAHGYAPSPISLAAIARALVAEGDATRTGDAWVFARAASLALPDDLDLRRLYVKAAVATRDQRAVEEACARAVDVIPDDAYGLFCNGILLAKTLDWDVAEEELLRSARLGVPDDDVQWALANGIRFRAWFVRRLRPVVWPMLAYALAPIYLLAGGIGLGRMTDATARRAARRGALRVSIPERFLHTSYRVVIMATSIWYYASIPVLWLELITAWTGMFLLYWAGQPTSVIVALVLSLMGVQYVLTTVYVGLTARIKHPDPGRLVSQSDAPGLWALVLQVAERLQTGPISAVYAIPDARIAVQEEGRVWDLVRGQGRRCLVLGLGLVPGMTVCQLESVIAHEYAHFANRDTAGGQLARQVHASLQRMAVQLTMVGQNKWYSPGWWYVSAFTRIFLLVTMGASRLHEILADRMAAEAYGVGALISALRHITRQDHTFVAQVRAEMMLAKREDRQVRNLYALPPIEGDAQTADLEARIATAIGRPTSRFDTHLSIGDRIELLEQMGPSPVPVDASAPAWDLFADPHAFQLEMTEVIRATVRRREDRLLQAVAEAHDERAGRLRMLWRRATWFWRTSGWPWSRER